MPRAAHLLGVTPSHSELAAAIASLRAACALHDTAPTALPPGLEQDLAIVLDAAVHTDDLLAAQERRAHTGVVLMETRVQLRAAVRRLAEIEAAALRHHRGDPYGPQGAAAAEILELVGNTTAVADLEPDVLAATGVDAEPLAPGRSPVRHRRG